MPEEMLDHQPPDATCRGSPPPPSSGWLSLVDLLSSSVTLTERSLQALQVVDRCDFVPPGCNPYDDTPQRIGYHATISAPHMHAMALRALGDHLRPGARALDIGCGSGFLSAVMARHVGSGGRVIGIDYLEPLVSLARRNVSKSHGDLVDCGCLKLEVGDGWKGCPDEAPFDAIHVGAAASDMPAALVEQLNPGGRMVIPIGAQGKTQTFIQVDKDTSGRITERRLVDVVYVPLVKV